jgi:drug/metabolite transporter (DMT)-like permease
VCFAALPVFSKIAFKAFGPGLLAFFRIAGMGLLFSIIFFFFQRERIKEKSHYLYMAMLAFFGATGNIYFYLRGLELSTAVNATILVSSVPVFTLLVALVLGQESFSVGKLIGVAVAFSGMGLLIDLSNFKMGGYFAGNLFILLNSFFYSIYLVKVKKMLMIYKPFTILTFVFIFASFEILPFTISDIMRFHISAVPAESYFPLFMVLTVGTLFPYLFNSLALKHAPSSFVAIYVYLQPVFAAVLAAIILGEIITFKMVISALLIILGVTIVRFPKILLFSNKKF